MPAVAVCLIGVPLMYACGDSGKGGEGTTSSAGPCTQMTPRPATAPKLRAPSAVLPPGEWTARITTNCGAFTISLDAKTAPKTAASFASLAKGGFYDGLQFHRIAPGFVIQGGDPQGSGTGGPGYSTVEPPPLGTSYSRGTVAMAKTVADRPGTAGSQFFIVTAEDAGLPADYAVLGRVTQGIGVVDAISNLPLAAATRPGAQPDGRPREPVVIESVRVSGPG